MVAWGLDKEDVVAALRANSKEGGTAFYTLLESNPFPERMRIFIKAKLVTNNGVTLKGYIMNEDELCFSVFAKGKEYSFSRHPELTDDFKATAKQLQKAVNLNLNQLFPMRYETGFLTHNGEKFSGVITANIPFYDLLWERLSRIVHKIT